MVSKICARGSVCARSCLTLFKIPYGDDSEVKSNSLKKLAFTCLTNTVKELIIVACHIYECVKKKNIYIYIYIYKNTLLAIKHLAY